MLPRFHAFVVLLLPSYTVLFQGATLTDTFRYFQQMPFASFVISHMINFAITYSAYISPKFNIRRVSYDFYMTPPDPYSNFTWTYA